MRAFLLLAVPALAWLLAVRDAVAAEPPTLDPDDLPALVRALAGTDESLRQQAASRLLHRHPPPIAAVPLLLPLLESPDRELRREAIGILSRIGAQAAPAAPQLVRLLVEDDGRIAAAALGRIGAPALPALLEGLGPDQPPARRRRCARALAAIGAVAASELAALREDPDPQIRHLVRWLQEQPKSLENAYVGDLAELLRDARAGTCQRVAAALVEPGAMPRDPELLASVGRSLSKLDADMTARVCTALGRLGVTAEPAAAHVAACLAHRDEAVRGAAADAMRAIAPARAAAVDQALAQADHPERLLRALAAIQPAPGEALAPLHAILRAREADAHAGAWRRREAARLLAALQPAAAPALVEALVDPSYGVRAMAAGALGRRGTHLDGLGGAFARVLGEGDANARMHAATILRGAGTVAAEAAPALVTALALPHQEPLLLAQLAAACGTAGRPAAAAAPHLARWLAGDDRVLRVAAAAAAGRLGDTALIAPLQALLAGEDAELRRAAGASLRLLTREGQDSLRVVLDALADPARIDWALGELQRIRRLPEEAVPALASLIDRAGEAEEAEMDLRAGTAAQMLGALGRRAEVAVPALTRGAAGPGSWRAMRCIEALGEIGPAAAQAVPTLIVAVRGPHAYAAAQALGRIGRPGASAATPALMALLDHPETSVRCRAAEALGAVATAEVGMEAAMEALRRAARDDDVYLRGAAAEGMGALDAHGAGAIAPLAALVRTDGDASVRAAAGRALTRLGPRHPQAVEPLTAALGDENFQVRRIAIHGLSRMGPAAASAIPALEALREDADMREAVEDALRRLRRTPRPPRRAPAASPPPPERGANDF